MAAARELVIWRGSQFSSKAIAALRVKGFLPAKDYKLSSAPMAATGTIVALKRAATRAKLPRSSLGQ